MESAAGSAQGGCGPAESSSAGGREPGGQEGWAGEAGGNWMATHPTFTEMMSLDISDSAQIYAAFVVYLDLLEGRNWHEVKHVGVAELQLICLHACEREQDGLQVMVPVPVHISLSHESENKAIGDGHAVIVVVEGWLRHLHSRTPEQNLEARVQPFLAEMLREIMKKASLPPDDPGTPLSVTLAIVESDSTVVYYKVTDGFVIPDPPDNTEDVDNKQWRKKRKKLFK